MLRLYFLEALLLINIVIQNLVGSEFRNVLFLSEKGSEVVPIQKDFWVNNAKVLANLQMFEIRRISGELNEI